MQVKVASLEDSGRIRCIPGDQMPPLQELFSNFYHAPEAVLLHAKDMVLEYLQIQSKACASLFFSASPPRIRYLSL